MDNEYIGTICFLKGYMKKKIGLGLMALLVNVSIMQGAMLESSAGTDTNALPVAIQNPYHAMADHINAINDQNIDTRLCTSLDYILVDFMFKHGFGLMLIDPKFATLPALPIYQCLLVQAIDDGTDGYQKDPDFLKKLAELDWDGARSRYIYYLERTPEPNIAEIKRLADLDWPGAYQSIISGLAHGVHGMKEDHNELRRMADNGCLSAQSKIVEFATRKAGVDRLKALVALGWNSGYTPEAIKEAEKKYDVKQDATGLLALVQLVS